MRVQTLNFLASSFFIATAFSNEVPSWITKGPVSSSSFHYVVCSHDGIDPEEARQIAESKCLASAAKLGGVNVKVTQKTVQSLTGSDSSEVVEIQPLEASIKCEWTDRFLERIKDGFRVWLRCKIAKTSTRIGMPQSETKDFVRANMSRNIEGTLTLTTLPQADRIIVIRSDAERVIEPTSNVTNILFSNLDQKIEVKKDGYKSATIDLPIDFLHGTKIQKEAVLDRN